MEKYYKWILSMVHYCHNIDIINKMIEHDIIKYEFLEDYVFKSATPDDFVFVLTLVALEGADIQKIEDWIVSSNNLDLILQYATTPYPIDIKRVENSIYQFFENRKHF